MTSEVDVDRLLAAPLAGRFYRLTGDGRWEISGHGGGVEKTTEVSLRPARESPQEVEVQTEVRAEGLSTDSHTLDKGALFTFVCGAVAETLFAQPLEWEDDRLRVTLPTVTVERSKIQVGVGGDEHNAIVYLLREAASGSESAQLSVTIGDLEIHVKCDRDSLSDLTLVQVTDEEAHALAQDYVQMDDLLRSE